MLEKSKSKDKCLFDILQKRAANSPKKIAYTMILEEGVAESITYEELYKHVCKLSFVLKKRGLKKGDRCLLIFSQGIEFIEAFIACNQLGIISIPLNMPDKDKEIQKYEAIAIDSECEYVCTNKQHIEYLNFVFGRSNILSKLTICTVEYISNSISESSYSDIAFLQYTSGSTEMPKGVMVTNFSLLNNLKEIKKKFEFEEHSVCVTWLPYYHDMGLILGILIGIYNGHRVILMDPMGFVQNPIGWINAISDYKSTHIIAPNFAYDIVTQEMKKMNDNQVSFSSLKILACGAEPVNINTMVCFYQIAKKFGLHNNTLKPGYGLAEATLLVSSYNSSDKVGWLKINRNKFQNNIVDIRERGILENTTKEFNEVSTEEIVLIGNGFVIDNHVITTRAQSGKVLGKKEIGEICFSGHSVTKGYLKKSKETNETFIFNKKDDERYLKTGDLGFIDDNGEIFITGRIKDLIIIRGMNFYPQDLERTSFLSSSDFRVDGAAAFSEKVGNEEKIVIIQELKDNVIRNLKCEEWAEKIRKSISRTYALLVETIVFVASMNVPRTESGKIQRKRAKQMYLNNEFKEVIGISETSSKQIDEHNIQSEQEIRDYIIELIAQQLKMNTQSIDTNLSFMNMGINSIMLLDIRKKIEKKLKVDIDVTTMFNYNTADKISKVIWNQITEEFSDVNYEEKEDKKLIGE